MSGQARRVFGYTDIHWSDRDPVALAVADAAHRYFKPHITIQHGDLHNCGPFSRHPKCLPDEDDQYDLLETELKPVSKWLDSVQKHTLDTTVILEGNHDEWIKRWIANNPRVGMAIRSFSPHLYHTANRKAFEWIPFTNMKGGRLSGYRLRRDLVAIHGWFANTYAARWHLNAARNMTVIFGHTHRADFAAASTFNQRTLYAFSAGCLCKKIPIYQHNTPTDWVHGFWVGHLGRHSCTTYPVLIDRNHAILPDGKEIKI